MTAKKQITIEKQLDYVLRLVNNRRERYKLWWNALIGLIVTIGAGTVIAIVSGKIEWIVLSFAMLIVDLAIFISTVFLVLLLFFFSIFFELHLIDDIAELVVFRFCTVENQSVEEGEPIVNWALQFIEDPVPRHWKKWKNTELELFIYSGILVALTFVSLFYELLSIDANSKLPFTLNDQIKFILAIILLFIAIYFGIIRYRGYKSLLGMVGIGASCGISVELLIDAFDIGHSFKLPLGLISLSEIILVILIWSLNVFFGVMRYRKYKKLRSKIRHPISPSLTASN